MFKSVLLKTLRDYRRSLFWWTIGLASFALYLCFFYPSIKASSAEMDAYIKNLPPALKATFTGGTEILISTPEGYLNTEMFGMMGPLLLAIFAIGYGSKAVAGEEEKGTLDLLLANPMPRWRLVLEKFAGLVVATTMLSAVMWAAIAIGMQFVDLPIDLGRLAATMASLTLLAVVLGSLALAIGSATGKKGLSVGVTSFIAIAAYLLNSLSQLVDELKGWEKISIFYYYVGNDPLVNGVRALDIAALAALALLLAAAAAVTLQRRDLSV